MEYKIKAVEPLPDFILSILFESGERKKYDVKPLIKKYDCFNAFLLTHKLFEQVKVDNGGYGVYWNKELDISCNELYINGAEASHY